MTTITVGNMETIKEAVIKIIFSLIKDNFSHIKIRIFKDLHLSHIKINSFMGKINIINLQISIKVNPMNLPNKRLWGKNLAIY
jgi:hypothetical protein